MISLSLLLNETQRSGRIWDVARIYAHKNPTTKRGIIDTDAAYVSQLTSCLAGKPILTIQRRWLEVTASWYQVFTRSR
jgi:hypothetical protein